MGLSFSARGLGAAMTAAPEQQLLLAPAHVRHGGHAGAVGEGKHGAARSYGGEVGLAKNN